MTILRHRKTKTANAKFFQTRLAEMPTGFTWSRLLLFFVREKKFDQATELFQEIKKHNAPLHPKHVMKIMLSTNSLDYVQMFELLQTRGTADLMCYTVAMQLYQQKNQPNKTLKLFESMKRDGIEPDLYAYNIVLDLHQKLKNEKELISTFEEILWNKKKPNLKSYTILLYSFLRSNDWEKVDQYYGQMIRSFSFFYCSVLIIFFRDGHTPDLRLFTILINFAIQDNQKEKGKKKQKNLFLRFNPCFFLGSAVC